MDSSFDSYESALPKLKLAEVQSDLNTDDESSKKSRGIRKRVTESSSEDDNSGEDVEDVPTFPAVPKPKPCIQRPILPQTSASSDYMEVNATASATAIDEPATDCRTCSCKFNEVLQILREQHTPNKNQNGNKETFDDFTEKLPIKSEEEIFAWEKQLSSKDEQKKMISFLAYIGGHEVNTIVKNILRKLLTDAVASLFNWERKKGKKMFSSLIISDCMKKAADQSPNLKARSRTLLQLLRTGCDMPQQD
ncbi:unnamed protein product [Ceutorhynchus assimilis]|uniref:DUF4806 domain-containing protein n=1 Tax=Ceutorhynchus assimilis TaxID=467358 RepID=A0A9N9MYJ0_9CUCU|nr:unnamed protein product [Ceutorhynchus assimilis]